VLGVSGILGVGGGVGLVVAVEWVGVGCVGVGLLLGGGMRIDAWGCGVCFWVWCGGGWGCGCSVLSVRGSYRG